MDNIRRYFNTTGACNPQLHYMVDIQERLEEIKNLVDAGKYFTINRARQYGKTTTIKALAEHLEKDYVVISLDFQRMSNAEFADEAAAWTKEGFLEAEKLLLSEKSTLFESLMGKLHDYPSLKRKLYAILFGGKKMVYNPDDPAVDIAVMFGFLRNDDGTLVIANRIFETRLYAQF